MALTKDSLEYNGITIPNPYIRLVRIVGGKASGKWRGMFSVYANKEMADAGKKAVEDPINIETPWVLDAIPEKELYSALKPSDSSYKDV